MAALMSVLAECVNGMKKDDIKTYQSNLFTLFLEALDFRVHHDHEASLTALKLSCTVETNCRAINGNAV